MDTILPYAKMTRGKSADVQLRATDVVYVPESKAKTFLANTQGIIAAATAASINTGVLY